MKLLAYLIKDKQNKTVHEETIECTFADIIKLHTIRGQVLYVTVKCNFISTLYFSRRF